MQLVPLGAADRTTDRVRASDAPASGQQHLLPLAGTDPARFAAAPTPRRGLRNWAPALNQQVATAQQSLEYLDTLSLQLQDFKGQLSLKLAGGFVQEARLEAQRQGLERLWQERSTKSGGGLDAQLEFTGDVREAQAQARPRQTKAESPALAPASWRLEDAAGQRQALPQVVQAARSAEQAGEQVRRVLAQAGDTLNRQRATTGSADAAAFVQHFGQVGRDGRYSGVSALASSLHSLPRYRIDSLLALREER